jgi:hypothetical protein
MTGEATETWSHCLPFVWMRMTAFRVLIQLIEIVSSRMKLTTHNSLFTSIIRRQIAFWNVRSSMLKVSTYTVRDIEIYVKL